MKRMFLAVITSALIISTLQSQTIKSPGEFLSYEPGTQFTYHHKAVEYFKYKSVIIKKSNEKSNLVNLLQLFDRNQIRYSYAGSVGNKFNRGSIIIARGDNKHTETTFDKIVATAADECQVKLIPASTGLGDREKKQINNYNEILHYSADFLTNNIIM